AWRLSLGWERPFWFDETFSGAIATEPTVTGLVRHCLNELGGPVYYGFLWLWEKLAGAGEVALRLPSAIFSIAAPALLLVAGHEERRVRLLWAAFAALSVPALDYSNDARSYALLFLLGCVQAMLYIRLIARPRLRLAAAWCTVSMLLILTHYHTVPLVAAQGLVYLLVHRVTALKTWPAALLFIPVALWLPFHYDFLASFSRVAWQEKLTLWSVLRLPDAALGFGPIPSLLLAAAIGATAGWDLWRRSRKGVPSPYDRAAGLTFLASLLGMLLVLAIAMHSRSFHARYLIPFTPGVLLGVALWTDRFSKRWPSVTAGMVAIFLFFCGAKLYDRVVHPERDPRWEVNFGPAMDAFRQQGAEHVVFFWDHPMVATMDPTLLSRVGSFYFDREGVDVRATPLRLTKGADANPAIRAATAAASARKEKTAVLWMYWPEGLSAGGEHPPQPQDWGARPFDCRDYGVKRGLIVLGCIERDLKRLQASPAAALSPS
ncbi:MAG TPA: glycosyltransferase family 39 protein, partial [Opitutus sp.]|nr:glycosyltransferase family 39 protein [Opitutus sp.]